MVVLLGFYQTMRHFIHWMGPLAVSTQQGQQVMEPALLPFARTL
jgi:hypothetical protein